MIHQFQVGDEVAVMVRSDVRTITTIVRVTPSGRVAVRWGNTESIFHPDGYGYGSNAARIEPATQAHRDALRHEQIVMNLNLVRWRDLSLDVLERVVAALGVEW